MKKKRRKCSSAKTTTGYLLSTFSALLDGTNEGSDAALTVYTAMSTAQLPTHIKVISAASAGGITAVVHTVSSFCFQGAVIRKNFSDKKIHESFDDEFIEHVSKKKKFGYITLKYGYVSFALLVTFFEVYLLYSASKAWVNDLRDHEDTPLSNLSILENVLLSLYYAIFSVPFVLTNEIAQSCKEITRRFGLDPDDLPDKAFLDKFYAAVTPFARSRFIRKFIRFTGSFTDSIEHLIPPLILIPASWVLDFFNQPIFYTTGSSIVAALMFLVVTGTIFAQTYLFEGKYSEDNLKNIAWENLLSDEVDSPWINEKFAKFFHLLLYLGGPLHGIDSALFILGLRLLEIPDGFIYTALAVSFFLGWMGNHFSEVKESQESLQEMTRKPLAKLSSGRSGSLLFHQNQVSYGTINDDERPLVRNASRYSASF